MKAIGWAAHGTDDPIFQICSAAEGIDKTQIRMPGQGVNRKVAPF